MSDPVDKTVDNSPRPRYQRKQDLQVNPWSFLTASNIPPAFTWQLELSGSLGILLLPSRAGLAVSWEGQPNQLEGSI